MSKMLSRSLYIFIKACLKKINKNKIKLTQLKVEAFALPYISF